MLLVITRSTRARDADHERKVRLLRFLLAHRDADERLSAWLVAFESDCLRQLLGLDITLRDEREALASILRASEAGRLLTNWSIAVFAGQGGSPDHLNMITLHSAKGLEFRVVIMMGMEQGRIPRYDAIEAARSEQRRLFYVGLSRAKDEVHLTYSGWTANRYGRRFVNGPSEFLTDLRDRLNEATQ